MKNNSLKHAYFTLGLVVNSKKINTFATRNSKQILLSRNKQDVFNNREEEGNLQEVWQIRG